MNRGFQYCTLRVGHTLRHFWLGRKEGQVRLWEIRSTSRKLSAHMVEIKAPENQSILPKLEHH